MPVGVWIILGLMVVGLTISIAGAISDNRQENVMTLLHIKMSQDGRGETPAYVPYHSISFFFQKGDLVELRLKDGRTLYHKGSVNDLLVQLPEDSPQ